MLFITCTAYSTTYRWLPHDYLVPGASKLLILVYIHYTVQYVIEIYVHIVCSPSSLQVFTVEEEGTASVRKDKNGLEKM